MGGWAAHEQRKRRVVEQFASARADGGVRLAKPNTNLFRGRAGATGSHLDVGDLDHVIHVDPDGGFADVEGMATYETIVDATLPYGLMPTVVPRLKSITLGGAATGVGIESSSFRYGLVHETVDAVDVLVGTGEVVHATHDNEHADLFHGFPNSYGTLGYALALRTRLVPVKPYIRLRHLHFDDAVEYLGMLERVCAAGAHDGDEVDFVDGVVFGGRDLHLTLGTFVDTAPWTSDYTYLRIYYRSIPVRSEDYLTVRDYIWRWDTDWFWCSRAFKVENPLVRVLLGRKRLRSTTYRRVLSLEHRHRLSSRLNRLRNRPFREPVIQDVEVPVHRAHEFLTFFHDEIGITPIWVCPTRSPRSSRAYDLYPMDPNVLYVNFGFWSSVERRPGEQEGFHNRRIEAVVDELGGRKSLYSTSFYEEDRFRELYNGSVYDTLKKAYDPDGVFHDLYAKCVRRV